MRLAVVCPGIDAPGEVTKYIPAWAEETGVSAAVVPAGSDRSFDLASALRRSTDFDGVILDPGDHGDDPEVVAAAASLTVPLIEVTIDPEPDGQATAVSKLCQTSIRGRGERGFRWAMRHLKARVDWPPESIAYGSGPDQVGDLRTPEGSGLPVVALLHPGFWREPFKRDLMDPLAVDLAQRGYATWNIEYRRVGPSGGGFPETLEDVAAAVDYLRILADDHPLDLSRVAVLGHSAGGHLALWTAGRHCLATGDVGASPQIDLCLAVSLAGVSDLVAAADGNIGDSATQQFMGSEPNESPERYRVASPAELVPIGVPQLVLHGDADPAVPVSQSRTYHDRATAAGDEIDYRELPGIDHNTLIDPWTIPWSIVTEILAQTLQPSHERSTR